MNFYDLLLAKKLNGGGGGGGEAVLINKNINANGTYNASTDNADGYKKVVVNVPNPSTGSLSITSNNTYDVTNYASAVVNVPQGITPTGTLNITSNDTYDVTNYANAVVNVPQGITPTGTISITTNGTVDVTNYASADVNVSGGGGSSFIGLIDTISVSTNVRAVNIDLTPYSSYDVVFIFEKLTLSDSDYLYYLENGSTPSGGTYSPGASATHIGWCGYIFNMPPTNTRRAGKLQSTNMYTLNGMNSLYIYTYTASKTILAGSEVQIYGGKYADL